MTTKKKVNRKRKKSLRKRKRTKMTLLSLV
jgi:hypothetical protein